MQPVPSLVTPSVVEHTPSFSCWLQEPLPISLPKEPASGWAEWPTTVNFPKKLTRSPWLWQFTCPHGCDPNASDATQCLFSLGPPMEAHTLLTHSLPPCAVPLGLGVAVLDLNPSSRCYWPARLWQGT